VTRLQRGVIYEATWSHLAVDSKAAAVPRLRRQQQRAPVAETSFGASKATAHHGKMDFFTSPLAAKLLLRQDPVASDSEPRTLSVMLRSADVISKPPRPAAPPALLSALSGAPLLPALEDGAGGGSAGGPLKDAAFGRPGSQQRGNGHVCWEVPVHERRQRRHARILGLQRTPPAHGRRLWPPCTRIVGLTWIALVWVLATPIEGRGQTGGVWTFWAWTVCSAAGRRALCSENSQVPHLGARRYSCRRLRRQSRPPCHARRCSAAAAAARAGSPPAAWSAPRAAAAALCRRQWTAAPMREFAMPPPNPAPAQDARIGAAACTGCRRHASKVAVRQVAFSSSRLEKGQLTSPPRRQWGKHEMQPLCRGPRTSWGRSH